MRTMNYGLLAFVQFSVATAAAMAQAPPPGKLGVMQTLIEAPILTHRMKLTEAIMNGAKAMRRDYMVFGIELAPGDYPTEPMVIPTPPVDGTVGEYLRDILRQVPMYEYEAISEHMVTVYPRGAKEDPNDVLNLRVPRFDVDSARAGTILGFPALFIQELRSRISPKTPGQEQIIVFAGPVPPGPEVTLHLRDLTVRDILNAVSVATEHPQGSSDNDYPFGWIYRTSTETGEKKPYWGVTLSLPPNWRDLVRPATAK